jgi:predicted outer membrane lipoprotein
MDCVKLEPAWVLGKLLSAALSVKTSVAASVVGVAEAV